MVELLNAHLSTVTDLYSQTTQAHGNVKGINFIALHELFDKLALVVEPCADLVAERATALGGVALGTTRQAIDIAARTGDTDTADLFTGISREIDKALWFLDAHLS